MLSENAELLLQKRYYRKDTEDNIIEDWQGLCKRVADYIGKNDEDRLTYFNTLYNRDFLPNTPMLFNAGGNGTMSACFHFELEDSMDNIMDVAKHAAMVTKYGGGTGFDFSSLRPKGDAVKTTHGKSSGCVSFMHLLSVVTDKVTQSGRRDAANLGSLRIDHPEILGFLRCKNKEEGFLSNMNISVLINEEFMNAVKRNLKIPLVFNNNIYEYVEATTLFDIIVEGAWKNGEPGVLFIDEILKYDPLRHTDQCITGSNPCGEMVLASYEACSLGSINLSNMLERDDDGMYSINYSKLKNTTIIATRFLDDSIDVNTFPVDKIKERVLASRKLGLGIMGFAEILYKLKIRYGSEESIRLAEDIMSYIQYNSLLQSVELSKEYGAFPLYHKADFSFIEKYQKTNMIKEVDWCTLYRIVQESGLRNATVTTIAPTGSLSIIADTSGGIEPHFNLVYYRNMLNNKEKILVVPSSVRDIIDQLKLDNLMIDRLTKDDIKDIAEIPEDDKKYLVVASDISVEEHINIQAAFQKFTSNAISKTINLPNSATTDDVRKAILLGYESKCKGLTIYRDGSRNIQVLNKDGDVPDSLPARRLMLQTPYGKATLIIAEHNKEPLEIYMFPPDRVNISQHEAGLMVAICRIIALGLQGRKDLNDYIKQLKKSATYAGNDPVLTFVYKTLKSSKNVNSLMALVWDDDDTKDRLASIVIHDMINLALTGEKSILQYANVLHKSYKQGGDVNSVVWHIIRLLRRIVEIMKKDNGDLIVYLDETCSMCGSKMVISEGCAQCLNCFHTKCG